MIHRSPFSPIDIPDVPLTSFSLALAQQRGDKPAMIDGLSGRTLTYADLVRSVRAMAGSLARRGFGSGDVLAIYSPNVQEYAIAFHAASILGGVITPVNHLFTAEELAFQIQDSRARFLVTARSSVDKVLQAAGNSSVQEIFVVGGNQGEATPFDALLEDGAGVPTVSINAAHDIVVLPYSSGTTGLPKGVLLSHRNVVSNVCQLEAVHRLGEDDRLIAVMPFSHMYGITVILNLCLHQGVTVISLPRFDLEQFLWVVQHYRVTRAPLVPPIVLALSKHPIVDRYDLSHLKTIYSGAAPLSPAVASECMKRLGCSVVEGYGMTESSSTSHVNPADPALVKLGAVGPSLPNTEWKIVDSASGEDMRPGEAGEVWVRGPQVSMGYLNRPEAAAETFDAAGWLHSGDLGYADRDGYLHVVDRLKELIKYKGEQVAPAELEAILLSHPDITDAAVIPTPDKEAGEVPKALVVTNGEMTEHEIMQYVNERVAPYKKVRTVEFVQEIPKSAAGKILRRQLVEIERARI